MIILNCTKKVLDELPNQLSDKEINLDLGLKEWYVNVVRIGRKRYLIFLNSKTLFCFFTRSVKKADFKNLEFLFKECLEEVLLRELSSRPEILKKILNVEDELIIRKSKNRSKLGSLNEVFRQLEGHHYGNGDVEKNRDELNHALNNIPMSPINWEYPIERLKKELGYKE